jgi:hypothetical protein
VIPSLAGVNRTKMLIGMREGLAGNVPTGLTVSELQIVTADVLQVGTVQNDWATSRRRFYRCSLTDLSRLLSTRASDRAGVSDAGTADAGACTAAAAGHLHVRHLHRLCRVRHRRL